MKSTTRKILSIKTCIILRTQASHCYGAILQKKKKMLTTFSSRKQPPEVFYEKCCPKQFAKLTGKHLWHFLFFNKVWGLKLYWERESGLGAFLLFLGNLRIPFYRSRTPTGDCLLALTNFAKNFILDVRLGSNYTFYMQC